MDTSETYIKQCEKAEEIQRQFKEVVGDWLYMPKDGECAIVAENFREYRCLVELKSEKSFAFDDPYIWLPRQDQLQTLSGLSWYLFDKTCVTWATTNSDYQRESKEIVGLRVVMKLNYKKQWLDNDWKLDNTI